LTETEQRILRFVGHMNYIYRSDLEEELHEILENMVHKKLLQPSTALDEAYLLGPKAPKSYKKLRG